MMFTAKVKDGGWLVDPVIELPEGATVTVLIDNDATAMVSSGRPRKGSSSTA
jgi:hypothetical protein